MQVSLETLNKKQQQHSDGAPAHLRGNESRGLKFSHERGSISPSPSLKFMDFLQACEDDAHDQQAPLTITIDRITRTAGYFASNPRRKPVTSCLDAFEVRIATTSSCPASTTALLSVSVLKQY
jgi:hypothetical protein